MILDYIEERQNHRDRQQIRSVLTKLDAEVRYHHARSWEYPGLQVADAVVWAWAAGGPWRRLAAPVISRVVEV